MSATQAATQAATQLATQPATSGATPSHRKPNSPAEASVITGVGSDKKYQASASERTM